MTIIYDINVFPEVLQTFDQLIHVKETTGFVLWDSGREGLGVEPKVIYNCEEEVEKLTLLDIRDEKNKEIIENLRKKQ